MDKGGKLLLGLYKNLGLLSTIRFTYATQILFYVSLNFKECYGLVCNMCMWHFLVLLNYFL